MGIPWLDRTHCGGKISFGSSSLAILAGTLVEIDLASESDWIAAGKLPCALVERVFGRYLGDRGQQIVAEHFELSLTLGEAIVDRVYADSGADANGRQDQIATRFSRLGPGVLI